MPNRGAAPPATGDVPRGTRGGRLDRRRRGPGRRGAAGRAIGSRRQERRAGLARLAGCRRRIGRAGGAQPIRPPSLGAVGCRLLGHGRMPPCQSGWPNSTERTLRLRFGRGEDDVALPGQIAVENVLYDLEPLLEGRGQREHAQHDSTVDGASSLHTDAAAPSGVR